MSALQHLARGQTMAGRPFAIKKSRARKLPPLGPPPSAGEKPAPARADEELALIQRAAAGESEAQTRLFATYTPRLYRLALSVLRNKEDAEDAVQDTWRRAYSKFHTFQGRSSISTWLTRIAINSALMIRRRNKRRDDVSLNEESNGSEDVLHHLVDTEPTPEEDCKRTELAALFLQQIHRLAPAIRGPFLLRHVEGLTVSELAGRLGLTSSALKSRVHRARQILAQNLLPLLRKDRR
jgi:RNA polymerase sigma-70 factor, ECF subfamily